MKNFKEWIKCASIRAVRTMAQTAVSLITVGSAFNEVEWVYVISVSVTSGIVSLLTSLGGLPEVKDEEEIVE